MPTAAPLTAPPRAPWWLCLIVVLATAGVAIVWIAAPATYPYGSADIVTVGFNHLIEREAGVVITLTAAALGVVVAVLGLRGRARWAHRIAGVGAAVEVLCLVYLLGDGAIVSVLGYAVALGAPLGVVTILVLVGRRWPRTGVAMMVAAVIVGAIGIATGALAALGGAAAGYVTSLVTGGGHYYRRVAWTLGWLVGAACWAWAAVAAARRLGLGDRTDRSSATRSAAIRRWGRRATIVAALCPVPYGLARLTWVTPWPLGGNGPAELVLSRELTLGGRLQGFLFAPAVAVGVVLTLGLISRWGEVFPQWIPRLRGCRVPVRLAVIPGGLMSAVLCIAAPGFLIAEGGPLEVAYGLFFFPFPLWGPALGFAVFAYWYRRTHQAPDMADTPPARLAPAVAPRPMS